MSRQPPGHRAQLRPAPPPRRRWLTWIAFTAAVPLVGLGAAAVYYYFAFARLLDARLHGERERVLPRVYARPLELRRGQQISERRLIEQLNDLGYAERPRAEHPGEFAAAAGLVTIVPRAGSTGGQPVRVLFRRPSGSKGAAARPAPAVDRIESLEVGGARPGGPSPGPHSSVDEVVLDAPLLTSIISGEREKRRPVALSAIPARLVQAVLAIEDRRFYAHPGVDPIGVLGAVAAYATGRRDRLAGGSTITQQLVRNVFLPKFEGWSLQAARRRDPRRKLLEVFLSIILSRRASKDEILEMYLNDIPLGQRGSFAIAGVAEAARLFFGKDVSNVSLAEAATIAGVIQSPSALSPFTNPARCRERRNVVLEAMAEEGYISRELARRTAQEPLVVVQRALDAEAPHFVDFVGQTLADQYPGLTTTTTEPVEVYTTLDLQLQRLAQDAVRDGLARVDELLARRRRRGRAEAALIAVDPRTGEILAWVGGRSYNQSQYNRVIASRRQPGSTFKPFVFLAAFEQAAAEGRTDITPATIVLDEPQTFVFDNREWTPENYEGRYDGPVTYRYALAHSKNLATIHVAEAAGYDRVAAFWASLGVGAPPKPYPSIALGVFEATPYEIATAYTIFPNAGLLRPLRHIARVVRGERDVTRPDSGRPRRVARPDTTYLVTDMMRSVLAPGGTGAAARAAGFTSDAAGKTGTTNDLRDAWFAGFTPDLLTVVWVGFDDNQPLGLSGAQAALPIWTEFMKRALAGRRDEPFAVPDGIVFADIDDETGQLATPACPHPVREAFLAGTEPTVACERHTPAAGAQGLLPASAASARPGDP